MTVINIETPNTNTKTNKAASTPQRTPSAPVPPANLSDAKRFNGQPAVQWYRLQRAIEELMLYKVSGRHHTAAETNEPRSHARWRKESVGLLRALADAIVEGQLEPEQPKKPVPELDDVDGIQW